MNIAKKRILSCLMALTILLPAASYAQQEYLTIGELREQVEGGWQQTYETKWRTVEIDAEVKLPQTDAVPILKVVYDIPQTTVTAEESGWLEVERRLDALILYNGWKKAPKTLDGKRINANAEAREVWRSNITPEQQYIPMSDITYGEICDMLCDNLLLFGYDPAQFQLDEPVEMWAQHWFLYGYKKDALPGQLFIDTRQVLYDLPILGHISPAVHDSYTMLPREDEMCPHFELSAGYDAYGEQLSHLYVNAAKPVDHRFIGVRVAPFTLFDKEDHALLLIVNAKSNNIDAAMNYVEYHVKGMDAVVFSPDEETLMRDCLAYSTALWQ